MTTTRETIELRGRFGAGLRDETNDTQTVRVLDLFNLVVHRDDESVTPCLIRDGYWESWITSWVMNNLKAGASFVDIGANCGYYTLLAEQLVGKDGFVIAYEPNPKYVEMLRASRTLNSAEFKIREFALLDRQGKVTLSIPDSFHGSATVMYDFEGTKYAPTNIEVSATTLNKDLSGLLPLDKPYLIKIDAESAEEVIWRGGDLIWNSDRAGAILLEWTPNSYSDEFTKELYSWGDITYIDHSGQEQPISQEWLDTLSDWAMLVIRKK